MMIQARPRHQLSYKYSRGAHAASDGAGRPHSGRRQHHVPSTATRRGKSTEAAAATHACHATHSEKKSAKSMENRKSAHCCRPERIPAGRVR
jgi:hypothetical protein